MTPSLYTDCRLATMIKGQGPYGLIEAAAVVLGDERIEWVGPRSELPTCYQQLTEHSLGGRLVTPALIDCHTHLVYGGNRAREFEMRLEGASYEEIARAGGGILSTVRATREASDEDLIRSALIRLDALLAEGVAVVEVKSGYGLTIENELRMLRIARKLEAIRPVRIVTTWLAAHALSPEYRDRPDAYIEEIVITGLEQAVAEGLVDHVDGFCENIGFTPAQMERVFEKAKALGLPVKLHAEQLSDQKGAVLAAKYGALSVDHLEYLDAEDVPILANANVTPVLLPGAFYYLRESKLPPLDEMRAAGMDIALATDCNPGSSPLTSLLLTMNMACTFFRMTPEEALSGVTRTAAAALGLAGECGVVAEGAHAELAVWNAEHPSELSYTIGANPLYQRLTAKERA